MAQLNSWRAHGAVGTHCPQPPRPHAPMNGSRDFRYQSLFSPGNYPEAHRCYDKAIELDPASAEAHVARGAAHANQVGRRGTGWRCWVGDRVGNQTCGVCLVNGVFIRTGCAGAAICNAIP